MNQIATYITERGGVELIKQMKQKQAEYFGAISLKVRRITSSAFKIEDCNRLLGAESLAAGWDLDELHSSLVLDYSPCKLLDRKQTVLL